MKLSELPVPSVFKFKDSQQTSDKNNEFIRYGEDSFKSTDKKNKFPYRLTEMNRDYEVVQLNTGYSLEVATIGTIPYGVVFTIIDNKDSWFKANGGLAGDYIVSCDEHTLHKVEHNHNHVIVFPIVQTFDIIGTKLIEFKRRLKV